VTTAGHYYDTYAFRGINGERSGACMFTRCTHCHKGNLDRPNIDKDKDVFEVQCAFAGFVLIRTNVLMRSMWGVHSTEGGCEHWDFCHNVRRYGKILVDTRATVYWRRDSKCPDPWIVQKFSFGANENLAIELQNTADKSHKNPSVHVPEDAREKIVNTLYMQILHRRADRAGIENYSQRLLENTEEWVAKQLANSDERRNLVADKVRRIFDMVGMWDHTDRTVTESFERECQSLIVPDISHSVDERSIIDTMQGCNTWNLTISTVREKLDSHERLGLKTVLVPMDHHGSQSQITTLENKGHTLSDRYPLFAYIVDKFKGTTSTDSTMQKIIDTHAYCIPNHVYYKTEMYNVVTGSAMVQTWKTCLPSTTWSVEESGVYFDHDTWKQLVGYSPMHPLHVSMPFVRDSLLGWIVVYSKGGWYINPVVKILEPMYAVIDAPHVFYGVSPHLALGAAARDERLWTFMREMIGRLDVAMWEIDEVAWIQWCWMSAEACGFLETEGPITL
jgi:hypothetical protein